MIISISGSVCTRRWRTHARSLAQNERRKRDRSGMNQGRTEARGRYELEDRKARQWDCGQWLSRFSEGGCGDEEVKAATRKACRKEVWEETRALVSSGSYLGAGKSMYSFRVSSLRKRHCPWSVKEQGVRRKVHVIEDDILSCAARLCEMGQKVAVLNMACGSCPGGGVCSGAGAQEENLYRRTDICSQMEDLRERYYPLKDAALVTSEVTILRGREEDGYPYLRTGEHVTVISCAALNKPPLTDTGEGYRYAEAEQRMRRRVRNVLVAAAHARCEVVLLSAFGCGAYRNPPQVVARLFSQELPWTKLERVIFCIKEDGNSGRVWNPIGNCESFRRWFPDRCCHVDWRGWQCQTCGRQIPECR